MSAKPFLDTNILIYAFTANDPRSARAEALVTEGGIISIQVLNEFVNVSRRKLRRSWQEIDDALSVLETLLDPPLPLTIEIHKAGMKLVRDHKLAFYDGLIVAAAVLAGCSALYSEDLQDGRKMESVTIRNPFVQ